MATNRNVQMGLYPTNGVVMDGTILQTARIDRAGAYNATTGTVIGDNVRTGPWRIYSSIDDVVNGSAFSGVCPEIQAHNAGHTVILSWGQGSYPTSTYAKNNPGTSWWAAVAAGYIDAQFKSTFSRIHGLSFGGPVTPVNTTTGSKEPIPGSTKKGTTPTEVVLVPVSHEPNIGATQFGTPAEFAAAMKHVMTMYDTWVGAGTKRIKFAVIISYPGSNVFQVCGGTGGGANYYGVGTGNDISGASARPVDYPGWDIYFPAVEKGNGPATPGTPDGGNGNSVYFATKFGQLNTWVYSTATGGGHFSTSSTRQLIGEIACRIQTAKSGDGTAINPTWPDKFWNDATNGFTAWNNAHRLTTSNDHPLIYVCSYAANALMQSGAKYGNGASGNIDNSIIPDTTTWDSTFQNGGFSLRNAWVAYRTCLVNNGNETMTGANGVTPTGLAVTTPAAGVRTATLTWTTNAANVSYNLYVNGVLTQPGLTGGSYTVSIPSTTALPHSDTLQLTGVGTNNTETALSSSVTVNYTAGTGTVPGTSGTPTVTNVGQTTATFSVTPVATATGYAWYLDSNVTTASPDFTSVSATTGVSGLASGSHTVKCKPFNTAGYATSFSTASSSFTMASAPDTTGPTVPSGIAATASASSVPLTWTASTDQVVAGAVTSGMGRYDVARSLSSVAGSGTIISPGNLLSAAFTDSAPPASPTSTVDVWYSVQAYDVAGNPSGWSTPFHVVIPQSTAGALPIAVPSVPTTVNFDQLFAANDGGSIQGTGGNIVSWVWDFGDTIPANGASVQHSYSQDTTISPRQFTGSLTVVDASGANSLPAKFTILATPTDSGGLNAYTGTPMYAKNGPMTADVFNTVDAAQEAALAALDQRVLLVEGDLAQIGDPLTPRRHNNALFCSVNPEAASTFANLASTTFYVVRCTTINGASFSTVKWVQTGSSVSTVTGAFIAVYDVAGNLVSPTGALTDVSSMWMTQGEQTFTLDGGPFDPPLGADNTTSQQISPSEEFFVAFYIGTTGANKPQFTCGSTWPIVNLGTSSSAIAPTQANIQTVPLFSTSSATVGTALNAPASLGNLTRWSVSAAVALYA